MEKTPATLNISEKAMKYHFLPRKSMFGFLKNSIKSHQKKPVVRRRSYVVRPCEPDALSRTTYDEQRTSKKPSAISRQENTLLTRCIVPNDVRRTTYDGFYILSA